MNNVLAGIKGLYSLLNSLHHWLMVKISSDNPDVEKSVVSLCGMLEKNGSYIDAEASIVDVGGVTSVFVSENYDAEFLFKLRHEFLIPYDHFDFDVEGQDIVIAHDDNNQNKQHRDILEQMIGLYNGAGKFSSHVSEHPLLRSQECPKLVKYLLGAREGRDVDVINGMLGEPDLFEELALLTFFKSRLLNCRLNSKENKSTAVLIPVMEFMNHHHAGAIFENLYSDKVSVLSAQAFMPVSGSRECFTRYGRFDSLDTYLHYGFADESAPYVRSIPLRIDLGDLGTVSVRGYSANVAIHEIPAYLGDLAFYFPRVNFSKGYKVVELSHLFIPNEKARFSMRRILGFVIQAMKPDIDEAACASYVEEVENQILETNLGYYDGVKSLADPENTTIGGPVLALVDIQKKKIVNYNRLVNS